MSAADLLRPLLAAARSASALRQLATELEQLAARLRQQADAQERVGGRLAAEQARQASRPRGGRPAGSGGRWVRVEQQSNGRWRIHIAAALYAEISSPTRIDLQRLGGQVVIRAAERLDGYAVTRPTGARGGLPRIAPGEAALEALRLDAPGRYAASVSGGAIVFFVEA